MLIIQMECPVTTRKESGPYGVIFLLIVIFYFPFFVLAFFGYWLFVPFFIVLIFLSSSVILVSSI